MIHVIVDCDQDDNCDYGRYAVIMMITIDRENHVDNYDVAYE